MRFAAKHRSKITNDTNLVNNNNNRRQTNNLHLQIVHQVNKNKTRNKNENKNKKLFLVGHLLGCHLSSYCSISSILGTLVAVLSLLHDSIA